MSSYSDVQPDYDLASLFSDSALQYSPQDQQPGLGDSVNIRIDKSANAESKDEQIWLTTRQRCELCKQRKVRYHVRRQLAHHGIEPISLGAHAVVIFPNIN